MKSRLEHLEPSLRQLIDAAIKEQQTPSPGVKSDDDEEDIILPFPLFPPERNNKLEERGVIFITGTINNASLESATQKLLLYHFDKDFKDEVQVIINSPGGELDATWAFIDTMQFIKNNVRTIAMGEICSAATMIFVAGDHRVMAPHSMAMIHQFSSFSAGSYGDLVADRKVHDMIQRQMIRHFIDNSKYRTEKEIRQHLLLQHDNWLSPTEMKKHGLCDEISRTRKHRTGGRKRKAK